jgi:prolyl oligopeptidase
MSRSIGLVLLTLAGLPVVMQAQLKVPIAPSRPVTDTYFGATVVDPYRWMEAGGPELLDYMKAENAVTEEALKPFATQNASILDELTKLEDTVPAVREINRTLDQYFYLETPPGKSDAQLKTRPVSGGEGRLLLDPATMASAGQHAAIDYFVPSPDGRYVAIGVSLGGSENSTLHVLDVSSGKLLRESISRAQDGAPSWTDDSKGFYFSRLQEMVAGAPASTKYDNRRVYYHLLGGEEASDVPVFGPDVSTNLALPKNGDVAVQVVPGTKMLLASQVSGVVETPAYWVRRTEDGPWTKVVDHSDTVLDLEIHGTRAFGRTKGGAHGPVGNGQVMGFDLAKETFANARVVVPESGVILSVDRGTGIRPALDALYVYGFHDALSVVVRVPYEKVSQRAELPLPVNGTVVAVATEDRRPGATVVMEGWTTPPLAYTYSPLTHGFADTGLQLRSPVDMSAITSKEVLARSADGTMVPLSILYQKDIAMDGSNPTLLDAYGAYGIQLAPTFNVMLLPWLQRGGIFAVAHVRGGGERGEAWHLAGMKTTKQHTVDDFVACARYLIAQNYTSTPHLGIEGTSAGGIAVGGFLTQHPELVGAVLYRVGITDILRSEQRATGAMNAFEYGSVKVQPEFHAMYAISPYAHVQEGAKYPPVMLETGANDPRVTSWMLTKMTARLQAANGGPNPILLRVDFDAGHGIGSGRKQALKLTADEYTFLGWRLGMKGFAETTDHRGP